MWISDFAIRRPIVTIVAMLTLVLFGAVSLLFLKTDEFPDVNPPVVSLAIPYPGASPDTVERELAKPVEDAINGISGVDRIRSTSYDGFAVIVVEFVFEKDLQQATQDIRDKLSAIRLDLPSEMEEPVITRFDPNDLPVVSLTLSSDSVSTPELTKLADPAIVGELQSVSGVASVDLVGAQNPELTVEVDPEALEAAGISMSQVVMALQSSNLAAPVGRLTADREERTIRLQGRLDGPHDFEDITLTARGGRLVRLGEVAKVYAGVEEARSVALFDGKEAVGINIVKATGASTTQVSEDLRGVVEELRKTLPKGVELDIVRDSGTRVDHSVTEVQHTLIEGALLTVLVVFLFLGSWRSTVITGLALPVSVLAAFISVWVYGYTLNTMSLLGLSLSIGILVDDAIVVRENIVRHMEMGKDHYQAARDGTAEIGLAVAATTFSIVVVFVPVAFMGGIAEQFMAPMALTIASSVMVSLLVSFSLDPMLSAYWPDPEVGHQGPKGIIGRVVDRFNKLLDRFTEYYKRVIAWALNHRLAMVMLATASFVGALALPAKGLVGSAFFPVQDRSEFILLLEMTPGSSLELTTDRVAEAARLARSVDGVAYTYATVGGIGGTVDEASVYVRLVPKKERNRHQDAIGAEVSAKVDALAGVNAAVVAGGFANQKQIQLVLNGPDIVTMANIADELVKEVKQVPGAVDVGVSTRGQKPELEVRIDRDLAASVGLSLGQVAQALRPAFAGIDVGDWTDPNGETRDVRVRFAKDYRNKADDLASMPLVVAGPEGAHTIPLGQIAEISAGRGPAQIQHVDRDQVIIVQANARGLPLSEVLKGINERLDAYNMPPGYSIWQSGDVETQKEVFGRMFGALGVAVMLMYLILVVQFGSFLDPLAIMLSLPLSLIGVMLALLLTSSTVNLMSMIGIILLMGIVAKNAILLVDFAKWAEEKGLDRKAAIIEAGGTRLRPILMTSVAIVAGMIPVAVGLGEGADFRAPLGRAVIGGIITSTFLTLLVIPTLYDMLSSWREAFFRRFMPGMLVKHAEHPVEPAVVQPAK